MSEVTTAAESQQTASVPKRGARESASPRFDAVTEESSSQTMSTTSLSSSEKDIRIIFSDVDGTLVHYPSLTDDLVDEGILKLPPSATGMQGVISSETLAKCQQLRNHGMKFVLISGMRTLTLLKRIPFLPRADAYCSEAGGRIFFPTDPKTDGYVGPVFRPVSFKDANEEDLTSFGLVEDMEWRRRMERLDAAGPDGYAGAALDYATSDPVSYLDRRGLLWSFAQSLTEMGYILDTEGYSACFRVNVKQQTRMQHEAFDSLKSGAVQHPTGLATSTNLGCVDYYPNESGKKNCCAYLAEKFIGVDKSSVLEQHAICLCDDDNDLEMAIACQHAYIPEVSSETMAEIIARNPNKFTVTGGPGQALTGTRATDRALDLVMKHVMSNGATKK